MLQAMIPAHARYDIFDLVKGLWDGEISAWIVLGAVAGCIAFFYLYEKVTGKSFVKSKKKRREARRRRKHVLWEYQSDN